MTHKKVSERATKAVALRRAGHTLEVIAKRLKCSTTNAHYLVKKGLLEEAQGAKPRRTLVDASTLIKPGTFIKVAPGGKTEILPQPVPATAPATPTLKAILDLIGKKEGELFALRKTLDLLA